MAIMKRYEKIDTGRTVLRCDMQLWKKEESRSPFAQTTDMDFSRRARTSRPYTLPT